MSNDQRGHILVAVANPMQFLYAPFELAIGNVCIGVAVMMVTYLSLGFSPIWGFLFILGGHISLILLGTKNPHLTTTLRATGKYAARKRNLIGVKTGVKYVP